ncbi:MAG: alpha/beta hydrolase [Rhodobacteraceae bacterium]|nr:alpha/beta hydrolase [Paracoccaceae bacterium]
MKLDPAPFHHQSARAAATARAYWAHAADGVRLRVGHLSDGPCGTVLLLPGRTEYLEKYGEAAREFAARGFGVVALDYRGQGLADRLLPDQTVGHVEHFSDYQLDARVLVAFAEAADLPRPWFGLGHSLGGAILLRALISGMPVSAAVFSAPMWRINMAGMLYPVAWLLGWIAHATQMDGWVTPGTSRRTYVREADPGDNLLTSDPDMILFMRGHLEAVDGLDLGGPSVPWLYRAMVECRSFRRIRSLPVPSLTFAPSEDRIVRTDAMYELVKRWPNAQIRNVDDGRHETMMETPARRRRFFDESAAFFDAHR